MSILLSAYYPEGIVFAADKNATIHYETPAGERQLVEPTATKVLSWPYRKAIVGFVGLGMIARLTLDEWMRIFIAGTRDFDDIGEVARTLRDQIQRDFDEDFRSSADISNAHLIVHLGGFTVKKNVPVPVMYHIWNHGAMDLETGEYPPAQPTFHISEDIERDFTKRGWPNPSDYPTRIRNRLQRMVNDRRFLWYNNGANLGAFNTFKAFLWHALLTVRDRGFAPDYPGLGQRIAFCKMAVEVFGSFFQEYYLPEERSVGGGVDVAYVPWPE